MVKTIIGSFDSMDDAHRASRALRSAGFLDSDINFIANDVRKDGSTARTGETEMSGVATGAVCRRRARRCGQGLRRA